MLVAMSSIGGVSMKRRVSVLVAACAVVAAACGSSAKHSSTPTTASYHPTITPSNFRAVVDNPWLPLKPGSTYIYTGVKDGKPSRDAYVVTHETKTIDGVPTVVVSDELSLSGHLAEKTRDYYTQDRQGNVWYFGEDTEELDQNGKVTSREGSWHAGRDGAEPGIFMEANPGVGHGFRQEYYAGHAEDQYRVVNLASPVHVPYGTFRDALLTQETTRLEPDVVDHKYYVKGVGEVAELSVKGPQERALLVTYRPA
jgi:hypothetical protein